MRIVKTQALERTIAVMTYSEIKEAHGFGQAASDLVYLNGGIGVVRQSDGEQVVVITDSLLGDRTTVKEMFAMAAIVEYLVDRNDDHAPVVLDFVSLGKVKTLIRRILKAGAVNLREKTQSDISENAIDCNIEKSMSEQAFVQYFEVLEAHAG